MPRALRKINPLVPPQEAGKLPTFSGDAECKRVGVRDADALTEMFFQEPALLSGDGARVLCLLFLTQRRGIKIGQYRAYHRGCTAVTLLPTHNTA